MAAQSTVVKHTDITVIPTTLKEADRDMSRLYTLEQKVANIEAKLAADIARLRERARAKVAPLKKKQVSLRKGLMAWGKLNRRLIVTRFGKSIRLTKGVVEFRYDPPSVTIKKIGEKRMITRMKKQGNGRYIRVEESLNRELLRKEQPYIPGITYRQTERCRICPDPSIIKQPRISDPVVQVKPA
jgi:phage host-nuclease inhibitor protein Gam